MDVGERPPARFAVTRDDLCTESGRAGGTPRYAGFARTPQTVVGAHALRRSSRRQDTCLVADSAEPCYGACRFPVLLQIGLLLNFRPVFGSWRSVFRFRFRGSCNRRPLVEFGRGVRGVFRASGRGAGHDSLPGCFLSSNASVRFAVHFR